MVQRLQERTPPTLGKRSEEESEEGRSAKESNNGREYNVAVVGGVGEVPTPLAAGTATGKGEVGASDNLVTMTEAMEAGEDKMEEGGE